LEDYQFLVLVASVKN